MGSFRTGAPTGSRAHQRGRHCWRARLGPVLAARETSAPSQPAPPKIAPPMAGDEAADAYFLNTGRAACALFRMVGADAWDRVAEERERQGGKAERDKE